MTDDTEWNDPPGIDIDEVESAVDKAAQANAERAAEESMTDGRPRTATDAEPVRDHTHTVTTGPAPLVGFLIGLWLLGYTTHLAFAGLRWPTIAMAAILAAYTVGWQAVRPSPSLRDWRER